MNTAYKNRLGDMLLNAGVITNEQLQQALEVQSKEGLKLGQALVSVNAVKESQLVELLSEQLQISSVDLTYFTLNIKDVMLLSEAHARRFRAIVLKDNGDRLLVGMADPTDLFACDELQRLLPRPIELAIVAESQLLQTLDRIYRRTEEIATLAGQLDEEIRDDSFDIAKLTAEGDSDVPVVRMLQKIFEDAVQMHASDIHIEPDENQLRIRQRVDGVLHEQVVKEKRIATALVLRLKLMAELNISERRLPQDGRFHLHVSDRTIDVRISTMPVQHGESVVMRLLDQSTGIMNLDHVGIPPKMLSRFRHLIHQPHGLVLVTGPTGSGKTTTLYGALKELNTISKKIITVEDPVEYRLERVNQVGVNPKIGLDFATVLRAGLRQDPDILLVGEIRDQETASIALRAAITGHLVLSTLHTNDAISSAMRLLDIGIEGYMAAAALRGVLAQRLVRKVCKHCASDYQPSTHEQQWLQGRSPKFSASTLKTATFKTGTGCSYCNQTGYSGRIGIFELLEFDESMADALRANDNQAFAKAAAASENYVTLTDSALEYAAMGITSLKEVFRVTEPLDIDTFTIPVNITLGQES